MISFTDEQQKVIDARNKDILVSAAAGSGKTAVLVERIIQRLLDETHPCDIDHMLVVTFTRAAAKEMKEKIRVALDDRLREHPGDKHLKRQASYVFHSQITTIDSFCNHLVKNYFYAIGVEPDFRMISSNEYSLMETEIIEELFRECYEAKEEGFLNLVNTYGTDRSDAAVSDMVLNLSKEALTNPWAFEWLDGLLDLYQVSTMEELKKSPMISSLLTDTKNRVNAIYEALLSRIEDEKTINDQTPYLKTLSEDSKLLKDLADCNTYEEYQTFLSTYKFATAVSKRGVVDLDKHQELADYRESYKSEVKTLQDSFKLSLEEVLETVFRHRAFVETLISLSKRFIELRYDYLEKKNAWDFNDIEHFALEILVDKTSKEPTPIALELMDYYEEIMVDEYQDSNYLQEAILRTITREGRGENNYFMVGDIKQSIYRFRQARPEIFREKYYSFSGSNEKQVKFELDKNFRSRKQVVNAVNDVFLQLMDPAVGGVAYDNRVSLKTGANYPAEDDPMYRTEIILGMKDKDLLDEFELEDKSELEANIILNRIRTLMKTMKVYDQKKDELRDLKYSDIVILLRSGTNRDTYLQVLNNNGVPAFCEKAGGFFDTTEVQTVVSFLSILDNPRQDIPLASVMHSKMFSFSDEELLKIRTEYKKEPFYKAVFLYAAAHPEEKKLQGFLNLVKELRGVVEDTPIHELIQQIYEKTDYITYVYALPGGENRRANLLKLIDLAIQFEKTSFKGLFRFCNYIDRLKKKSASEGEAELLSEEDNVVRIMTIHHSKGLEFPVVFLSEIDKQFNTLDTRGKMILHSSKGLALEDISFEKRTKKSSLIKNYISGEIYRDTLGEEMRLLYVAMTRAKEKLILTGTYAQEKMPEALKGKVTDAMRLKNEGYGGWMLPIMLANKGAYNVSYVSPQDVANMEVVHSISKETLREDIKELAKDGDKKGYAQIYKNIEASYPYQTTFTFKGKYSVSELKHKAMESVEEKDAAPLPFSESVVSSGAAKGTAMHRFMECFDLKKLSEEDILEKEISRMAKANLMADSEIELLDRAQLDRFLSSDLAKEMQEAALKGNLYREQPFVFGDDAKTLLSDVYPEYTYPKDGGPLVLLQGIIDVFYETEAGFVLLDYKTDRVADGEELKKRYAKQMDLYASAIENAYDKKVVRRVLYSFSLGKEVLV